MIFLMKKELRFTRKIRKVYFISPNLLFLKGILKKSKFNKTINIYKKSNIIFRYLLPYQKVLIHIGKYKRIFVLSKKVLGYKLGEFFFTRRFGRGELMHQRKKKKKK
jgi:ribosomal protein S19